MILTGQNPSTWDFNLDRQMTHYWTSVSMLMNFRGDILTNWKKKCSPDTTPAQPHLTSNLQQTKNETTNVVINITVASS